MKPNKFFAIAGKFCLVLLFLSGLNCGKEDNDTTIIPSTTEPDLSTCTDCELLYYGQNASGTPLIDAGAYEAAARFTPSKIGNLVGKTIKEIHYFIEEKPDSIKLKLYGPSKNSTGTTPGDLLYSADVTDGAKGSRWNAHILTQAITLKNEDMWLSIEFKLAGARKTIGCAGGPALPDADWLYSWQDLTWIAFSKRSGGYPTNWTIRLNVEL